MFHGEVRFMELSLLKIGRGGILVLCFRNWESALYQKDGSEKVSDEILLDIHTQGTYYGI